MMEIKDITSLAVVAAKSNSKQPLNYQYNGQALTHDAINSTLRDELNELAGSFTKFAQNKHLIFQIMTEVIDEVLPVKVLDRYMEFAEVKNLSQNQKAVFKQKVGRERAKKNFVTRVGLAGVYETFKLDSEIIEVTMTAVGGAAQIGIEEFLDGTVDFSELLEIILEGLDEAIYLEVAEALKAMVANLSVYNKYSTNGFVENKFDQVLATADAYGPSTIYCTYEFAATMIPADEWASNEMKNERWSKGFIANYKGHKVIILPQSVTEDNSEKVIDPSWAYIFPAGMKPVKLAFEGQTLMREVENDDWSKDIQVYKKFGVATVSATNAYTAYQNTALVKSNSLA